MKKQSIFVLTMRERPFEDAPLSIKLEKERPPDQVVGTTLVSPSSLWQQAHASLGRPPLSVQKRKSKVKADKQTARGCVGRGIRLGCRAALGQDCGHQERKGTYGPRLLKGKPPCSGDAWRHTMLPGHGSGQIL